MAKKSIINNFSVSCGIVSTICFLISRYVSKNPLELIHILDNNILPPTWLFSILFVFWYFLIGYSSGEVMFSSSRGFNSGSAIFSAYRGGIFLTVCFFMGLVWYPLFFSCNHLMLSLVISIILFLSSVLCTSNWYAVKPRCAAIITTSYSIWAFYIVFISLSVIIQN